MKAFSSLGWKLGGGETTASWGSREEGEGAATVAYETDPLLRNNPSRISSKSSAVAASSYIQSSNNNLRERRKSPVPTSVTMNSPISISKTEPSSSYTPLQDDNDNNINNNNNSNPKRAWSGHNSMGDNSSSYQNSNASHNSDNATSNNRSWHSFRRSYLVEKAARDATGSGELPPLVEIPEEIYAVRKAALRVLKPLTRTWVRRKSIHLLVCNTLLTSIMFFSPLYGRDYTSSHESFRMPFIPFSANRLCGIRHDRAVWNGSLDTIATAFTLLVHSTTLVVGSCRALLVPYFLCQGIINIHR
jgi:hypothetical protein